MADQRIVVFTLKGCGPCEELKMYLEQKDIAHTEVKMGEEISIETFNKIYPDNKGFPHILVDNEEVYDLILYLESGL